MRVLADGLISSHGYSVLVEGPCGWEPVCDLQYGVLVSLLLLASWGQ